MLEFEGDALAQRLRSLEVSRPDPSSMAARALAAYGTPRRAVSLPTMAFLLGLMISFVLIAGPAAYYAPVFSQALANAPVGDRIAGHFLRSLGLASVAGHVSALKDSATSSGYTVELIGGYSDDARTVLVFQTVPVARLYSTSGVTLRDQFGAEYRQTSAIADVETGHGVLTFEPIRWPAQNVGARLDLTILEVEDWRSGEPTRVAGNWSLTGTVLPSEGRDLDALPSGQLGSKGVTFTQLRKLPGALLVEYQITPATVPELSARRPDSGNEKGAPIFAARVLDAAGAARPALTSDMRREGESSVSVTQLWEVPDRGAYELVLVLGDQGSLSRRIFLGQP